MRIIWAMIIRTFALRFKGVVCDGGQKVKRAVGLVCVDAIAMCNSTTWAGQEAKL